MPHLASHSDVLRRQHCSIWRRFVAVGFDAHPAGDADNSLATGEIGHVDKGVVVGREDVCDAEDVLSVFGLGSEDDFLFLLGCLSPGHGANGGDGIKRVIKEMEACIEEGDAVVLFSTKGKVNSVTVGRKKCCVRSGRFV